MSIKRNYILGIINDKTILEFEGVISKYASMSRASSSHMYFSKQPIDSGDVSQDVIFFQIECENESKLDKKVKDLISDLNELEGDYVLRDGETGEMLVTVRYGGQIAIKLDKLKTIKKGTFEKIDELKSFNADFGYCKGFKPNFRPIEGNSIEDLNINPEVIYITADSSENLIKLRDFLTDKVKEIDSGLEVEFTWFFKDE